MRNPSGWQGKTGDSKKMLKKLIQRVQESGIGQKSNFNDTHRMRAAKPSTKPEPFPRSDQEVALLERLASSLSSERRKYSPTLIALQDNALQEVLKEEGIALSVPDFELIITNFQTQVVKNYRAAQEAWEDNKKGNYAKNLAMAFGGLKTVILRLQDIHKKLTPWIDTHQKDNLAPGMIAIESIFRDMNTLLTEMKQLDKAKPGTSAAPPLK